MVLKAVLKSISANATWHSSKSSEAPQFDMCATLSPLSAIWGNMQYAIPFVLMRTVEKGCKNCFIARHKCRQRSLWPVHNFICHNTCIYTLVYIYIYIYTQSGAAAICSIFIFGKGTVERCCVIMIF